MSRAHMLYDDKQLQSIPVKVTTWNGSWNPERIFQIKSEVGIIGDGKLLGKSRHLIVDSTQANLKVHYMVFHVEVKKAYRRKYDANGDEIQPDFGQKQKVNTGFLMSSYKDVSRNSEDVLSFQQLQECLQISELSKLTGEKETSLKGRNVISLWFKEKDFDGMEFPDGSEIRFRTKGEKCYVESISCLNTETKNLSTYTGDQPLGASWTDKVMAMKDSDGSKSNAEQQGEGAVDDEWKHSKPDKYRGTTSNLNKREFSSGYPSSSLSERNYFIGQNMQQQGFICYPGSSLHSIKFKVDRSISLEGIEVSISKAPTEVSLRLSERRHLHHRPLQCVERVFKADSNFDTRLGQQRDVHISFSDSVTIKPNRYYTIHATLKSSQFHPMLRNYRNKLSFDGVCLILSPSSSTNLGSAIFTAMTFRNLRNAIRRKIPITI